MEGYFEGEGAVGVREYAGGDGAGEAVGGGRYLVGGVRGEGRGTDAMMGSGGDGCGSHDAGGLCLSRCGE